MGNEVEWRIKARDGSSVEILVLAERFGRIKQWIEGLGLKLVKFLKKAWELGVKDPKKFIHGIKVATALTLVSLFYYVKPLYDGVEGNAMWAVMTVVVVFQYTAASATTFSRFIPTIKARFDYGAVIFILTFSLVSISGYRVDELFRMTLERILTIVIGTCFCIITSITIRPVWAGQELHLSITTNMDKLANSLDVCVVQYFNDQTSSVSDDESDKKSLGYKCVLSSKATEDSMAKFARWEPAHGRFRFRHPWKQYLKVGTSMRTCAACIDALVGCVNIENKDHHIDHMKEQISGMSLRLSANCASVIRELAKTSRNMTKSSKVDILVGEINSATQELQQVLKSNSITNVTKTQGLSPQLVLTETFQLLALASLLIEIAARVEDIVKDVQQLADWLISCLQTLSNLSIINPKILKIHAP
ncbi:aluminum-activated malate transporter 10 isoform X3 [Prosopis cineraria]|uniref:aluminum-activated malate transporter 10 isoform X3 n=1 Tax=Prosopis cineraria TaxID=364024 RepID=UPI00241099ED|nr:aluminum-activated malate transporter 10 isoform X3 [Prosopis cineraria]